MRRQPPGLSGGGARPVREGTRRLEPTRGCGLGSRQLARVLPSQRPLLMVARDLGTRAAAGGGGEGGPRRCSTPAGGGAKADCGRARGPPPAPPPRLAFRPGRLRTPQNARPRGRTLKLRVLGAPHSPKRRALNFLPLGLCPLCSLPLEGPPPFRPRPRP